MKATILLIGLILISSGCVTDDFLKGFNKVNPPDKNEVQVDVNTEPDIVVNPFLFESGKVVFYPCASDFPIIDSNQIVAENGFALCAQGLSKFIAFSENGLRCEFEALNLNYISKQLEELHTRGVVVKIVLNKEKTVKDCETGCVPRDDTSFTELFQKGLNVRYSDMVTENFCVNDKGVWYGTFIPSTVFNHAPASAFVFYSDSIREPFNERFRLSYGGD